MVTESEYNGAKKLVADMKKVAKETIMRFEELESTCPTWIKSDEVMKTSAQLRECIEDMYYREMIAAHEIIDEYDVQDSKSAKRELGTYQGAGA